MHMDAAIPCKKRTNSSSGSQETGARFDASNEVPKKNAACLYSGSFLNPGGNERNHLFLKNHEDHIAGKGYNSMNHKKLVHEFMPMPKAMKIPDAKAAMDKQMEEARNEAWQLDKVKSKKGGYSGNTKEKESPFCYIDGHMSSQKCGVRTNNSEVQGSRRAPRSTEQSSSASQMTAAQVMHVIAKPPDCDGQAADAVSAYTQVKTEGGPKLLRIPNSECPVKWIRLPRHKWPRSWSNIGRPSGSARTKFARTPACRALW